MDGSQPGADPSLGPTGSMSLHLVDNVSQKFAQVNVFVAQVQIQKYGSDWYTVATPNQLFDLLKLTSGVSALLAQNAVLPLGRYDKMRLILGDGCNVQMLDGKFNPLKIGPELVGGLILDCDIDLALGKVAQVFIDIDAGKCVQSILGPGGDTDYWLRPIGRVVDKGLTGGINGKLLDPLGKGLAGVPVLAQIIGADGYPSLVRKAFTDQDGCYKLDLLPLGATYYVASRPFIGPNVFAPIASGPLVLNNQAKNLTFDGVCSPVDKYGGLGGSVWPLAGVGQTTVIELMAFIPVAPGISKWLIVDDCMGDLGKDEQYGFGKMPFGQYAVRATRHNFLNGGFVSHKFGGIGDKLLVGPGAAQLSQQVVIK